MTQHTVKRLQHIVGSRLNGGGGDLGALGMTVRFLLSKKLRALVKAKQWAHILRTSSLSVQYIHRKGLTSGSSNTQLPMRLTLNLNTWSGRTPTSSNTQVTRAAYPKFKCKERALRRT